MRKLVDERPPIRSKVVFDASRHRKFRKAGNALYSRGIWTLKGGYYVYDGLNDLPDNNFKISFEFKTGQRQAGIFSIGYKGHDRHFCLKHGRPYVRVWRGPGWYGSNEINMSDNEWHRVDLYVADGFGQKLYVDKQFVG